MKAIVFAAGRGARMRPLTDLRPKPLLEVHGAALIAWHLRALARAGVRDVVVNTAWLEEQLPAALGDGGRWGLRLQYSFEGRDHGGALDTAGGIAKALPWLVVAADEVFWAIAADIYAPDFRYDAEAARRWDARGAQAHLWMVPNPPFHPAGDFGLNDAGTVTPLGAAPACTYAGIGLLRAGLFAQLTPGSVAALGPVLQQAARVGAVTGAWLGGRWANVGTPQDLAEVNTAPWTPDAAF